MPVSRRSFLAAGAALAPASLAASPAWAAAPRLEPGKKVLLVTADGLRWQDLFRGADPALLNKADGHVADVEAARHLYWRDDPAERRRLLFPFLWSEIAARGQLFGNRDLGSLAAVSNGKNFSYPGYNEILTGRPDPRIGSRPKVPNPNASVLEWLAAEPSGGLKAAAFGSWELFPYILNASRSKLHVNAAWQPIAGEGLSPRERLLNTLHATLPRPYADAVRLDALTAAVAMESIERHRPDVVFVSLGETDDAAHQGRYDHYLEAARHFDACVADLWAAVQALPEYRDNTHLILTTDHGRGEAPTGWMSHGAKVAGSEAIWFALLGPQVAPLGERKGPHVPLVQAQAAATVALLAGRPDYAGRNPGAAGPIPLDPPAA